VHRKPDAVDFVAARRYQYQYQYQYQYRSRLVMTTQLLIRVPDALADRLRRAVAPRGRSAFVQRLIEDALPEVPEARDPLYLVARAVERDAHLAADMAAWDSVAGDGLSAS
jgi:hypothetical protein